MVSDSSNMGILSLIPDSKIGVTGTLGFACIIGSDFYRTYTQLNPIGLCLS